MRVFVLACLLAVAGCTTPESVRLAEIRQAVIFDEISASFRAWVESVEATTPDQARARTDLLLEIEKQRGIYRFLHDRVEDYLDTRQLAEAFGEAEPVLDKYLEWLGEHILTRE